MKPLSEGDFSIESGNNLEIDFSGTCAEILFVLGHLTPFNNISFLYEWGFARACQTIQII